MSSGRIGSWTSGLIPNPSGKGGVGVRYGAVSSLAAPAAPFVNTFSLLFDGVDDKVLIPTVAAQQPTSALTVSAWVKGGSQGFNTIFSHYLSAGNQRKFLTGTDGNKMTFIVSADGTLGAGVHKNYSSSVVALDSTWNHIAATFASDSISLYINGTVDATPTKTTDGTVNTLFNNTVDDINIADNNNDNTDFVGNIDEVSMWDAELTSTDISNIFNSGVPADLSAHAKSANLVGWWRCGDGDTFPTIIDQQSNSNGTMTNMDAGDIVADVPP